MFTLAIQFWRGGQWYPLFDRQYPFKTNARNAAAQHIANADRQGLDPRNLAIVSFGRGAFEEVPWR